MKLMPKLLFCKLAWQKRIHNREYTIVHEISAEVIIYKFVWPKLYVCAENTQMCMELVPKLLFIIWPGRSFMNVQRIHKSA